MERAERRGIKGGHSFLEMLFFFLTLVSIFEAFCTKQFLIEWTIIDSLLSQTILANNFLWAPSSDRFGSSQKVFDIIFQANLASIFHFELVWVYIKLLLGIWHVYCVSLGWKLAQVGKLLYPWLIDRQTSINGQFIKQHCPPYRSSLIFRTYPQCNMTSLKNVLSWISILSIIELAFRHFGCLNSRIDL